jgi:hypothetical protein
VELGELKLSIIVLGLPTIKYFLCLSMYLVA